MISVAKVGANFRQLETFLNHVVYCIAGYLKNT